MDDRAKAAALEEIAQRHGGGLTPPIVVEEARAKDHPLHDYFEWRDGIAAEKYREDQARALIRSVRIQVLSNSGGPSRAPQWVRSPVKASDDAGYVKVTDVVVLEARLQVWRTEVDRAIGIISRAAEIAAAMHLVEAQKNAMAALAALRRGLDTD